jgi:hypothetical protein
VIELHDLYSSPNIITTIKSTRMRWAGHVARMGTKRNAYRILVEQPEGKIPIRRPRCRWVDNIKVDLRETGWGVMDLIDLAEVEDKWRALVNTLSIGMFLSSCTIRDFSRRAQLHE